MKTRSSSIALAALQRLFLPKALQSKREFACTATPSSWMLPHTRAYEPTHDTSGKASSRWCCPSVLRAPGRRRRPDPGEAGKLSSGSSSWRSRAPSPTGSHLRIGARQALTRTSCLTDVCPPDASHTEFLPPSPRSPPGRLRVQAHGLYEQSSRRRACARRSGRTYRARNRYATFQG